ncbi:hypothetical protein SKAU_G00133210 [Synaphobranchus kaupii]|uniref:Uncharacterized protein n=1 Tax=Synaphobranchus kaupii TaxID=118154 RepID=A0A9Q1J3P3_SYNKA|nr:hypothetical protein SKAU_G00133210 [Synaphobranchus kaupii]
MAVSAGPSSLSYAPPNPASSELLINYTGDPTSGNVLGVLNECRFLPRGMQGGSSVATSSLQVRWQVSGGEWEAAGGAESQQTPMLRSQERGTAFSEWPVTPSGTTLPASRLPLPVVVRLGLQGPFRFLSPHLFGQVVQCWVSDGAVFHMLVLACACQANYDVISRVPRLPSVTDSCHRDNPNIWYMGTTGLSDQNLPPVHALKCHHRTLYELPHQAVYTEA